MVKLPNAYLKIIFRLWDFVKTWSLGLAFWWEKRICNEHNFCTIIVLWKSFI